MSEYRYTASSSEGLIKSETIIAENEEEVRLTLKGKSLDIINIQKLPDSDVSSFDKIFNKVNTNDKVQFLEYFASMLKSGLSVNDVLQAFYEDLDKPMLRKFIKDTQYNIRNGKSLSSSFAAYPDLFPDMYVGMIQVGEASGTLGESLGHLAMQLKKTSEITSKVKNAMIYPAVIMTALTAVMIVLIVFVFPLIKDFFQDAGLELPGITLFFLALSDLIRGNWFLLLIVGIGASVGFGKAKKYPAVRRQLGALSLKLPIFGKINKNVNVSLFARTAGTLLTSGVNVLETMDVVYNSLSNEVYKDIVLNLKEDLSKGNNLSDSMKKYPNHFAPFEIRVIAINERSGSLAAGLLNIAEFYEARLFSLLTGLSSAMEPLLLLVMGGIVVTVAMSVITPIFQLMSGVGDI